MRKMCNLKLHHSSDPITIEVCVGSVADAIVAEASGADRLELCSATEVGGLTPSLGLVNQVLKAVRIPVIAMVRPRPGGFCYSAQEYQTAVADAKLLCQAGVAGLAFGFLRDSREIDLARTRELVRIAGELDAVFHRAFDLAIEPQLACHQLAEIGVSRVLTSGQAADALAGAGLLRELRELTIDRLEIMPGGGLRSGNAREVIQQTGCRQLHTGAGIMISDESLRVRSHDLTIDPNHRAVDPAVVVDIVKCLREFHSHGSPIAE